MSRELVPDTPDARPTSRVDSIVLGLALAYFAAKVCYIAVTVAPYVPPDEDTHFGVSLLYSQSLTPPTDSPESYSFGLVAQIPNMYYILMGRVLHANVFSISDLTFLRLANGVLGLLTVVVAWLWVRNFTEDRWARSLFVVAITNTLMFTFLCAAVNYDNLTNLFAAMACYFLARWDRARNYPWLALLACAVLAGCLTKQAFLPLAAIFAVVVCLRIAFGRGPAEEHASSGFLMSIPAVVLALVLLGFNLQLYGGNVLDYGVLVPASDQVLSTEQALQNRVFARDFYNAQYRSGRLTFEEASYLLEQLPGGQDRNDALAMLEHTRDLRDGKAKRLKAPEWVFAWISQVVRTVYGILAHQRMFQPEALNDGYFALWVLAAILLVQLRLAAAQGNVRWRLADGSAWVPIVAAYALTLLVFNYRTYLATGHPTLAVQGRYLFPVMIPAYGVFAWSLANWWFGRARAAFVVALIVFFIANDLPFFLRNAGPAWSGG